MPLVPQNLPNCCIMTCVRVRCLVLSSHFQGFHHFSGRGSGGLDLGFISCGSRWCCCRCTCIVVGDDREEREELLPARSQKEKEKKSFFSALLQSHLQVPRIVQEARSSTTLSLPTSGCGLPHGRCTMQRLVGRSNSPPSSTDYSASRSSGSIVQLPPSLAASRLGSFFLSFSQTTASLSVINLFSHLSVAGTWKCALQRCVVRYDRPGSEAAVHACESVCFHLQKHIVQRPCRLSRSR